MHLGVAAVIFDWAGTTVDHGCLSPLAPFVEVFRRRGIALTAEQARGPMGVHKRTHLERLCALPAVLAAWQARFGRAPGAADVDALFAELVPLQLAVLPRFATPVPGCQATMAWLRERGIRIGTTTGYTRAMMDVLAPLAAAAGFSPDVLVAADEVAHARPWPDMCLRNLELLGLADPGACVKVDDTVVGIEEGLRAGMRTVGVVMTGNELGLTEQELAALEPVERERRRAAGYARLRAAGAHVVLDGIAELPAALEGLMRHPAAG
ncbi:MAG: phosphonoacetaldehyde hydrolase [Polyangiaceae bacterium]|nr:phosphonoacetaldehyde hydrolase [Polyangiaceae bacterium]